MEPAIDAMAVTEVVYRLGRDAAARKALADAVASCDPAMLRCALLDACGLEVSAEMAATLANRERLRSARQHLFML